MALFRKKSDPISDRARALNSEIAALESQIRQYESNLEQREAVPAPSNSPFASHGRPARMPAVHCSQPRRELDLDEVDHRQLTAIDDVEGRPVHLNDLGLHKYDLPGLITKVRNFFRAPTTSNPKLVSYLAAGGIQGLRPLRYEKRVARNRFILFVVILFLLLLGILTVFVPR